MSSERRPWYKWYPKDFICDEKCSSLSPISELIYRRLLDVMWQSSACRLLNVCFRLANVAGKGISSEEFKKSWSEIQTPGYELFKTTPDGKYIYSKRLMDQIQAIESKKESGKKGGTESGKARAKQTRSKREANAKGKRTDIDIDIDIDLIPPISPKNGTGEKSESIPFQKIFDSYNSNCSDLPTASNLTKELKASIRARCAEDKSRCDIAWWHGYFQNCNESDYLTGKVNGWKASLPWLVGPKNMTKVLNGQYQNRKSKTDQSVEDFVNE